MKCPKCNYTSFDFYQTCQKCKRDLVQAKEKMNFPAFMLSAPANLSFATPHSAGPENTERMGDFGDDETTTMNFSEETSTTSESSTLQAEKDIEDTLNFDDDTDDLNFDDISLDDETPMPPSTTKSSASDTMDSDIDFSFGNESEEITLDMDGPIQEKSEFSPIQDDDTTDGDIDFNFNMDLLDEDNQTILNTSEDEISTASFDKADVVKKKDKNNVTMELEESVTALVDSIEFSEQSSDIQDNIDGTDTPELENLDLELDLDRIDDK